LVRRLLLFSLETHSHLSTAAAFLFVYQPLLRRGVDERNRYCRNLNGAYCST
jgi:hypothetical protein